MVPVQPTWIGVSARPAALVKTPESAPTMVTSRPSRIQVIPSALTTSQWKRRQGKASSRAGTSVATTPSFVFEAVASSAAIPGQTTDGAFGCAARAVALTLRNVAGRAASALKRARWPAAGLAALALVVWIGLVSLGLAPRDSEDPFVETRPPPALPERFYPPAAWAWGLLQADDAPPQRYGV